MGRVEIVKKGDKYFNDFKWVSKIIVKGDMSFKEALLVETIEDKKVIVCTDGKRLHTAIINTDIEDGVYTIKSTAKEIMLFEADVQFPDFRKAIPDKNDLTKINIDTSFYKKEGADSFIIYRIFMLGLLLNHKYILDAVRGVKEVSFYYNPKNMKNACVIAYDNKEAIIMPMVIVG